MTTPPHDTAEHAPIDRPWTRSSDLGPITRARLILEMLALYWVVPWFFDLTEKWTGRLLMPALIVIGIVLFIILRLDRSFDRRSLWNFPAFKRELPRILVTAALAFAVMLGLAWWVAGQPWAPTRDGEVMVQPFALIQRNPVLLLMICFLYPLFSVYPQEIILRTFFFHRYAPAIGSKLGVIVLNGLTFAWVHVIFVADKTEFTQWFPVLLSIPGGLLFAYTYARTKSTLASGIEHAIVGNLMWTAGLGWFFFAGAVAITANGG
jgi:hypothetical protein